MAAPPDPVAAHPIPRSGGRPSLLQDPHGRGRGGAWWRRRMQDGGGAGGGGGMVVVVAAV
jgi:hypothetical protein